MTEKPQELKIKVTSVYERVEAATKPVVVCYGGAASSKSHSIAQFMLWKLTNEKDKVIGIGRKTFPALRISAYLLVVNLLKEYGVYSCVDHNKSEHTIRLGSNLIQFFSLDDPEKIKSFIANYIWLEEANEFTFEDFTILKLRLNRARGKEINQLYLSFNPVDCWIFDKLENDTEAEWIHSSYKDNPFLSQPFIDALEGLREQDTNYYNIYALGQRGVLENIIYPHYQIVDTMPAEFTKECYGIDFGFENPTAVVHCGIMGDRLYIDEMLYRTHLTNAELIEFMKVLPRRDIYADAAEPQRIEELCRARLNCYPAIKNVQYGIDTVKRYKICITKASDNTIKEIRSYQRKKDKDNKILEEPVKFRNHLMDAMRYAVCSIGQIPVDSTVKLVEVSKRSIWR